MEKSFPHEKHIATTYYLKYELKIVFQIQMHVSFFRFVVVHLFLFIISLSLMRNDAVKTVNNYHIILFSRVPMKLGIFISFNLSNAISTVLNLT